MNLKKKIKLDEYDLRLAITALNEFRNKLIKEEKYTDSVNDLLLKFINTLQK